jgi:putative transposase
MLDATEILRWCQRNGVPERARALIDQIRSSEPSRRVGGGRGNVSGAYPSRKMGVTIGFESHRNELARIHEYEHDRGVLEYYDQPPPIKLLHKSAGKDGRERNMGYMHTPDFFVIRHDSAGYEECKMEEDLIRLAEKNPHRYVRGEDGVWRCPPGEEFAAQYGLYYRVLSSAGIDWTLQRNLIFTEDYRRAKSQEVPEEARRAVNELVEAQPGITLRDVLLDTEGKARPDDIYMMIVTEELWVDWRAAALAEPDTVLVFPDEETAVAYSRVTQIPAVSAADLIHPVDCKAGTKLTWDNQIWTIANVGETKVGLLAEDGEYVGLPGSTFEELVKRGEIVGVVAKVGGQSALVREKFASATRKDLEAANRKYELIFPDAAAGEQAAGDVSERTLRRYRAEYRDAEVLYGCGYVGLLPDRDDDGKGQGNHEPKLPEATRQLADEFIDGKYESLKQQGMFAVYSLLKRACEAKGVVVPSYKTFVRMIKIRPLYGRTYKRKGRRAAYKFKKFYWNLNRDTPRHGDRPFEIVHIDHTELDVELVCERTGRNLGRPWVTFVVDAYSRRLLVVYLTFDSPSYRTCMMVLRECVRIYGRLPQIAVVDNGPEFRSTYFQTLLARYECTIKYRPKAESKVGGVCERLFGTNNTQVVNNLAGNTQLMKNPREATKSVNPKTLAIWTLGSIYEKLWQYTHEVYNDTDHPALGMTPEQAFVTRIKQTGEREQTKIPYDEDFRLMTLPTTPKGTAKVLPGKGVKINNILYYSDEFLNPDVENTSVPVRFDPFDAGVAYAFVGRRWVRCISEHHAALSGRSEKELALATAELRRRHRLHSRTYFTLTAKKLADFLTSLEAEEVLLAQRAKDREARSVVERINNGFAGAGAPRPVPVAAAAEAAAPDTSRDDGKQARREQQQAGVGSAPKARRVIEEF